MLVADLVLRQEIVMVTEGSEGLGPGLSSTFPERNKSIEMTRCVCLIEQSPSAGKFDLEKKMSGRESREGQTEAQGSGWYGSLRKEK